MKKKKSKKNKLIKKLESALEKKIKVKAVIKTPKQVTVSMKGETQGVFDDEQRFFKGEYNKEKKRLFFQ